MGSVRDNSMEGQRPAAALRAGTEIVRFGKTQFL